MFSAVPDPFTLNNHDTATTTVAGAQCSAVADLSVTKSDSPDPVAKGGELTYTISVTNNGPDTATNVTVSDPLPSGVILVRATASPSGSCSYTVFCQIGPLSPGQSATVTIVVTVTAEPGSQIRNTATADAAEYDPDESDNSATAITDVIAPAKSANLSLQKSDTPDPVASGGNLTYTINVSNAGPDPANNVTIIDWLPQGVKLLSVTITPSGSCSGSSTITCNVGTLAPNGSVTVTIVVQVTVCAGPLNNTAVVFSATPDPDLSNNSDTESTGITGTCLAYVNVFDAGGVPEGDSGTRPAYFTIALTRPTNKAITVSYRTLDGTATASLDYVAVNSFVTIPKNQLSRTVPVSVIGDTLDEFNENFYLNATGISYSGSPNPRPVLGDDTGEAVIIDDDGASFFILVISDDEGHECEVVCSVEGTDADGLITIDECSCMVLEDESEDAEGSLIRADKQSGSPRQSRNVGGSDEHLILNGNNATGTSMLPITGQTVAGAGNTTFQLTVDPDGPIPPLAMAAVTFATSSLPAGSTYRVGLPIDSNTIPSGRHPYTLTITSSTSGESSTLTGYVNILNSQSSQFGAGWTLGSLERIYSYSAGALLALGDGTMRFFPKTNGQFGHAAGDFSTLMQNADGTVTRSLRDGTRVDYFADGLIKQRTTFDQLAHVSPLRTIYAYDDSHGDGVKELWTITDATNRQTVFSNVGGRTTSVTALGRTTGFQYDGAGNVSVVTMADNSQWRYFYGSPTSAHRLTRMIAPRQVDGGPPQAWEERLFYDGTGRVRRWELATGGTPLESPTALDWQELASAHTDIIAPAGMVPRLLSDANRAIVNEPTSVASPPVYQTTYRLDRFGHVTQVVEPYLGRTINFTRNADGLITSVVDALGRATSYFYNDLTGELQRIRFPDDTQFTYEYDARITGASRVRRAIDQAGVATTYDYFLPGHVNQGLLMSIDGPRAGVDATFAYDTRGNLTQRVEFGARATNYDYDSLDRVWRVRQPDITSIEFGYAAQDNLRSFTDERGTATPAAGDFTWNFTPDALGRNIAVADPLGHITTIAYDTMGNVVRVENAEHEVTRFAYDALNRVAKFTDPLNHDTVYDYHAAGLLEWVQNANQHTTNYFYDAAGRLTSASQLVEIATAGGGTTTATATTQLFYNLVDRVTRTIDPIGAETVFAYDVMDRVHKLTDALGHVTTYGYDAVGRVASVTEIDELATCVPYPTCATYVTRYQYTPDGRPAAVTEPGNVTRSFGYNDAANEAYFYDAAAGRQGFRTIFRFDAMDRLIERVSPINFYDVAHRTYSNGMLVSASDELNHAWTYQYDAAGRLLAAADPLGHATQYEYDDADRLVRLERPLARITTLDFDAAGRLISRTDPGVPTPTTFQYDAANNLIGVTDQIGHTTQYLYNVADQLKQVIGPDPDGDPTTNDSATGPSVTIYRHDLAGRIVSMTDPEGSITDRLRIRPAGATEAHHCAGPRWVRRATARPDRASIQRAGPGHARHAVHEPARSERSEPARHQVPL